MLVEDSTLLAREITAALTELGNVEVSVLAGTEEEACNKLQEHGDGLDVLIVDVFLRAGSGLGVVRAAQERNLPARVFVLTNFAILDVRKRCVALGAERVFDKSRQLDEFLDIMFALAKPSEHLADEEWLETQPP